MLGGSITFRTDLDNRSTEQKLERLRAKFFKLKDDIQAKKDKQTLLEKSLEDANKKIDTTKKKLQELKELEKTNPSEFASADTQAQIKAMEKEIASLEKQSEKYRDKIKASNDEIALMEENLNATTKIGEELQSKVSFKNFLSLGGIADQIKKKFVEMAKGMFVFATISAIMKNLKQRLDGVLANNTEFKNALASLKGALQSIIAPLITALIPAAIKLTQILSVIASKVAKITSSAFGKTLKEASADAKKLSDNANKATTSFDELNTLSGTDDTNFDIEEIADTQMSFEELKQEVLDFAKTIGSKVIEVIPPIIDKIKGSIQDLTQWLLEKATGLSEPIRTAIVGIANIISGVIDAITGIFNGNMELLFEGVSTIVSGIGNVLSGALDFFGNFINAIIDKLDDLTNGKLTKYFEIIKKYVSETIENLKTILNGVIEFIRGAFAGNWEQAWSGIKEIFRGTFNQILNFAEASMNLIINLLNGLINAINRTLNKIEVPEWATNLTGIKTWSLKIPNVPTLSIPRLAQGGVIPPNKEFLAMLGDNKQETEVVAPLSTMRQAMIEALQSVGYGGSQTAVLEVDGQQFGRVVYKANRKEATRIGTRLVEV